MDQDRRTEAPDHDHERSQVSPDSEDHSETCQRDPNAGEIDHDRSVRNAAHLGVLSRLLVLGKMSTECRSDKDQTEQDSTNQNDPHHRKLQLE
jgi:hypothetical protein